MSLPATARFIQVPSPNAAFETVERPLPVPGRGEVLIKVEACGMCHSDSITKTGHWPGISFPRVPGHEVIGTIVQTGDGVPARFTVGQRVGQGWHGGHCYGCTSCSKGDYVTCEKEDITGITRDGGYADYMVSPFGALAIVPEELKSVDAAPIMCAGLTVFNSLRNAGVTSGEVVAIQGIGGLGHLAIQFTRRMGFKTVAISTSEDKKQLALELGAHVYLDSSKQNVVQELSAMGGAKAIICTAYDSKAMSALIDGLGVDGTLIVLGAVPEPITVSPFQLIAKRRRVMGWASGQASDGEDTLKFAANNDVHSRVEVYTFDQVEEAYQRMLSNKARFRVVLVPSK